MPRCWSALLARRAGIDQADAWRLFTGGEAMMLARLAGCERTTAAQILAAFEPMSGAVDRFIDRFDGMDDAAIERSRHGCGSIRTIAPPARRWIVAMASAPSDLGPVTGRVDRDGRLTSADPPLLRLQEEAGSRLGAPLALPQLAAVARSAMKLGVPLSRAVIAASADQDLDLWVRAEPDAEGAALTIEGWKARPPAPPRLTLVGSEPHADEDERLTRLSFTTDAELKICADRRARGRAPGLDAADGDRPAADPPFPADRRWRRRDAAADRAGQPAGFRRPAGAGARQWRHRSDPQRSGAASPERGFAGYEIELEIEGDAGAASRGRSSIRRWTRRCARRSTGSSPPPSGSSTAARARCAATMPPMPATLPPRDGTCCR